MTLYELHLMNNSRVLVNAIKYDNEFKIIHGYNIESSWDNELGSMKDYCTELTLNYNNISLDVINIIHNITNPNIYNQYNNAVKHNLSNWYINLI